jgi:hypothetical protein
MQRFSKAKHWFLLKINKIDKPLANLMGRWQEKTLLNKIRDKKEGITRNTTEIQRTMREYFEIVVHLYDTF